MEIKLLLAKAISAIYYSSHQGDHNPETLSNLIDRTLEHLKLPEDPQETNRERSALLKVRTVLVWMKGKGADHPYDLNDLMARLRIAAGDNDRLYDLFCRTLLQVDDTDAARDKVKEISAELLDFIAVEEYVKLLRTASYQAGLGKIEDFTEHREQLMTKLQALTLGGKRQAISRARTIDLSNFESVADVYRVAQTSIDPRAILTLPFKAANRMTGQDGARRGEWSNVSALPGMNKSGQLLDTFISMCIFNKPVLFDETKKPLNVYTTIEDKLELVLQKVYVLLVQHEFGLPVIVNSVDFKDMAAYVMEKLQANGHHVRFVEFPIGGSSDEYIEKLRSFEEEGFEIISAGCDYVNLIGKQGIPVQVAGDEVQGIHRKIRGWTAPRNIYHYTAHQLSTDAKTLARQYPDDYIRKLPGKGYYEGCKKLDTEFDYEYMVAKIVQGGDTWQEVCWAKHRKMGATPDSDKYFVLKFLPQGMIGFRYDVHLDEDLSYKKVGARATNGEGGSDWRDWGD